MEVRRATDGAVRRQADLDPVLVAGRDGTLLEARVPACARSAAGASDRVAVEDHESAAAGHVRAGMRSAAVACSSAALRSSATGGFDARVERDRHRHQRERARGVAAVRRGGRWA
jgi:hypothetical protein